jgi:hypothetical protein
MHHEALIDDCARRLIEQLREQEQAAETPERQAERHRAGSVANDHESCLHQAEPDRQALVNLPP